MKAIKEALERIIERTVQSEIVEIAQSALASLSNMEQKPVAYGVPNSRPTEKQPFLQLLHSVDGVQYPDLLVPLYAHPIASGKDAVVQFTEAQIVAGARALADRSADFCNVNREDNWNIYGNEFIEEVRCVCAAIAKNGGGNV